MVKNEFSENESLERVKQILDIWGYNRDLYPGWIVYPTGVERSDFKRRTDAWEPPILASFSEFSAIERLRAIYELVWRREILLEPITQQLEKAAVML